jgi:hypothetical protein
VLETSASSDRSLRQNRSALLKELCNAACKAAMPTIASPPGVAEDTRIGDSASSRGRPTARASRARSRARQRGQSLAEFALVVPILLILFVGIADFGRVFGAGVAVEAATRNAAEAAANEYLADPPGPLDSAAPGTDQSYYDRLHAYAAKVVCAELRSLRDTTYDPATQTCKKDPLVPGDTRPDMPVVLVCVHDGADGGCSVPASPAGGLIPAECGDFAPLPTNTQNGTSQRWVEVRTCSLFTNILHFPLISFGDVWLQRTRSFTIPCYFVLGTDECG